MAKTITPGYATGFRLGMKVGKNSDADFVRGFNHGRKTAVMLETVSRPGPKGPRTKKRGVSVHRGSQPNPD